jgi:hypothetical protein
MSYRDKLEKTQMLTDEKYYFRRSTILNQPHNILNN